DNKYAEADGEISMLAVSKSGYSTIAKYSVSIMKAAVEIEPAITAAGYNFGVKQNAATKGFIYTKNALTKEDADKLTDAEIQALLTEGEKAEGVSEISVDVPEGVKPGTMCVIYLQAYDSAGHNGALQTVVFAGYGPHIDLAMSTAKAITATTATVHYKVTDDTKYATLWIGTTAALEAFTGDMGDAAALLAYFKTSPEGTRATIGTFRAGDDDDYTITKLDAGTAYSAVAIPTTKKNGTIVTTGGYATRVDFATLRAEDMPKAAVTISVIEAESNAYNTAALYTYNEYTKNFYVLCLPQEEYDAYREANPSKTDADMLIENGAKYSPTDGGRKITWKSEPSKKIKLMAVAINELDLPGEVTTIDMTTRDYVEGSATVDIQTSEVTATSARVICTPSANAVYYLSKQALDTQWK
ncbi:MAG: hypothetical protein K2M76_02565, partial [Muribaculaceae bacterium]|nr:hypothetical protein [Muribaculaceae bacterium]